ncbi:VPLPA-CTERM sorting domain-containing protein [Tropicibacter sp. S64]|uniref:VPLPA-CTERM sorting domain-containing protein n=1 Tax=Tropicibacter sp. S64 TaxID=3415122 RepID=UPI003C7A4B3D
MKLFTPLALSATLLAVPLPALAATLSYGPFTGSHYHEGGNIGPDYAATTALDRTSAFGPSGSGSFSDSVSKTYTGDMGAGRIGTADVTGATNGTLGTYGFSANSVVTTSSTCVVDPTPVEADCLPFIGMQSYILFEFVASADAQMSYSIDWAGGAGDPGISLADYFSFQFQAFNGFAFSSYGLPSYSTNELGDQQTAGTLSGVLDLVGGNAYRFEIGVRAQSQSNGEVGVPALDSGFFTVEASIAAVPLPAGLPLLLGGLSGLVLAGRRRKSLH